MINNVILIGHFKGFGDNDKLLLKTETLGTEQIIKINIASELKNKIESFIKDNDVIGIKGYIGLDDVNNTIIIATKISFLSKEKNG